MSYLSSGLPSFMADGDLILLNILLKKLLVFLIGYQINEIKKVSVEIKKATIIDIIPPSIPGPKYKNKIFRTWP